MPTQYTYNQDDFKNATEVNIEALQIIINNSPDYAPTVLYVNNTITPPSDFTVEIVFDDALSVGEEADLDALIEAYTYNAYTDTVVVIKDVRSAGTNGGTFVDNEWITRTLNTIVGDALFCSLSSNQFTLQPNPYNIQISAPACNVLSHQIRLYDATNDAPIVYGSSSFSTNGVTTSSTLSTYLNLTTATTYRVEHICSNEYLNFGLGRATGFSSDEIYTTVNISKL